MRVLWGLLLTCLLASNTLANSEGMTLDRSGGMAGLSWYEPDAWGLVATSVSNHSGQTNTALVAHALDDYRHIQYVHEVWLPSHSRRSVLTPVLPLAEPRNDRAHAVYSWLIDSNNGRERATPPLEGLLMAKRGPIQSAVMGNRDDEAATDMASALRVFAGAGTSALYPADRSIPALPAAWDVLDALVVARTPELDPAQVEAMRRWLMDGGRMWIMLDQVDPDFVQRLLGESWDVTVLDRAWFESLTIECAAGDPPYSVQREYGIEMLRVHTTAMDVTHRVNGYPAAARQRVGQGTLLVTTLHADGWLHPDPGVRAAIGRESDGDAAGDGVEAGDDAGEAAAEAEDAAAPPLQQLAWFFEADDSERMEQRQATHEALAGQARSQIGYTIIGRPPVLAVLVVFTLALLGSGLWLSRQNRLEWIGVAGVVLALITSGVLVGMGKLRQSEHPLTFAAADLVQPIPGHAHAPARGVVSVFRPEHAPSQVTFTGPADAIAFPDDARRSTERLRIVWHGLDRWTLPDLSLPAGATRGFEFDRVVKLDQPVSATVRLTEDGLVGQVRGMEGQSLEDALVAMPNGRMAARVSDDGAFTAGLDDQLTGNQFVRGAALGTLSQSQINRQSAYRTLLGQPGFPAEPVLLAWTEAPPSPIDMSYEGERRGQRLAMLPLQIERPEPGEAVTVPAPLMAMHVFQAEGIGPSTAYDPQAREFVSPMMQPGTLFMRFDPPAGLQAMEIDSAVLELHLDAPGWQYEVLIYRHGEIEPVHEGRNPTGRPVQIELDNRRAPYMHESGGVPVGLRLRPLPGSDGGRGWSLERMELSVQGVAR